MKIRLDFVTNSSSSSFIIMCKGMPEIEREITEKYPYIKKYIERLERILTSGNSSVIHTVEELNKHIVSYYGWSQRSTLEVILAEEKYIKEKYEKWNQYLADGYYIILKDVDNNDEGTIGMLENLNDGITFIVESEY